MKIWQTQGIYTWAYSQTFRAQSSLNVFLHIVQHVIDWVAPFPSSSPHLTYTKVLLNDDRP